MNWVITHDEEMDYVSSDYDIVCRFCGKLLDVHMLKKMRIQQTEPYHGHAVDIELICPDCRGLEIFGVAITEDTFKKLRCMEVSG